MIPKVIHSLPNWIQTYDINLFAGAPSVPKNAIFKTRTMLIEFESVMNSDSNSRQMQGFLKEIEFETSIQVHNKASALMLLILFLRKIFFKSKTSSPSLDMAHQQWCATCKYHNIGKTFVFKRINKLTQTGR